MKHQSSLHDGELYFQSKSPPHNLIDYLKDYSSDLTVQSSPSEAVDTQLWSITASVQAAKGKLSGDTDFSLGSPRRFTRWFSIVRIWNGWLAPRHGQGEFSPTGDAVLCSFLRYDGLHLVLLAVSGVDDVLTVFKPDGHGNVIISSRNDGTEKAQARVVVAVGKTFESANAAVMYHARKLVLGDKYTGGQEEAEPKVLIEDGVKADWMENWCDGLTYCTWNGLGRNLNEQKLYNALDILKENKIKSNLFIFLIIPRSSWWQLRI